MHRLSIDEFGEAIQCFILVDRPKVGFADAARAARGECMLSASKELQLARRRASKGKPPVDDDLPLVAKRSPKCKRFKMKVAFLGELFHGWMRQPGLRSIQGVLEDTIRPLLGQRVRIVPAGRTDAGVHAFAQICQFDAILGDDGADLDALCKILNAAMPADICIRHVEYSIPDFNVMIVLWKRYVYRLQGSRAQIQDFCEAATKESSIRAMPLDTQRMNEASQILIGRHDFAGFQSRGGRQSTIRNLWRCDVELEPCGLRVIMEADGFLMHMCRIIAGTLIEIGCGRQEPRHILRLFDERDRAYAGPRLPAAGLCLEHVEHVRPWTRELSASIPVLDDTALSSESGLRIFPTLPGLFLGAR